MDPDLDLRVRPWRHELVRSHGAVLAVISIGGGLGAAARYALTLAWPLQPGQFPWATFVTNVAGCFLIGVLMVAIIEVWRAHRLIRPFLGVGVLGGFTTFSTYAVETLDLLQPGSVLLAATYLAGTVIGALIAVVLGVWATRAATRRTASRERT
ncbi:fluoride efflux transporter CrcB [Jiangella anatolica]|uniref:Fluoride-specific ion channel FluC n=1 Tax=Jiangella anatolica TaxID=2670374 RepID=A0A2W2C0B2_9ACTN|nr:fluoride efflux transporter CrcB [Jiangella anatolica]